MTNDPEAVAWLEEQFTKQFRPGGGQRLDLGAGPMGGFVAGERVEEVFRVQAPVIVPPAEPESALGGALRRYLRLKILGRP